MSIMAAVVKWEVIVGTVELRLHGRGIELGAGFHEHDDHDVVAQVSLALDLQCRIQLVGPSVLVAP
jgi:hypothetical protein